MSPEQLLGELETNGNFVLCDMEAGVGTVLRLQPGQVDLVLVVVDSSAKSIEVARRAAAIAASRSRVLVLANRVRSDEDIEAIRSVLGEHEILVIPEDAAIERADREGLAPIDVDAEAPGVRVLVGLADRLAAQS